MSREDKRFWNPPPVTFGNKIAFPKIYLLNVVRIFFSLLSGTSFIDLIKHQLQPFCMNQKS
jgi:hypothetical protein